MDRGIYTLTVTNPDGGSGHLAGAFTVEAGIGQWNAGALYGGDVRPDPDEAGDPARSTPHPTASSGCSAATDAGEHWALVSDKSWPSATRYAIDPLHPAWVYGFDLHGLWRSQDEGVTWTRLMPNKWPDGRDMAAQSPQVFVSPYEDATHPQALFVGSCENYGSTGPAAPWDRSGPPTGGPPGRSCRAWRASPCKPWPSTPTTTRISCSYLGHEGLHLQRLGRHLDRGGDQRPHR